MTDRDYIDPRTLRMLDRYIGSASRGTHSEYTGRILTPRARAVLRSVEEAMDGCQECDYHDDIDDTEEMCGTCDGCTELMHSIRAAWRES